MEVYPKPPHSRAGDVVFIHGLDGSHHNFDYFKKYFSHSVCFDLPGFGDAAGSRWEEKVKGAYDVDFYLDFLRRKIARKSILVGHSFGAILAKRFALQHPELVERLVLISYPLQMSPRALQRVLERNFFTKLFLHSGFWGKLMCRTKVVWRYFVLPFMYLLNRKYFSSASAFLKHSYTAERKILDLVIDENNSDLKKLSVPYIMIAGEHDLIVDQTLLKNHPSVLVPGMGHSFFGFEEQITQIIRN